MRAVLLGGGIALLISLLGTRVAIRQFTRLGYGQEVRDDGPTTHHTKRGTPTMGGLVIILATVIGYVAAKAITWNAPSLATPLSAQTTAPPSWLHWLLDVQYDPGGSCPVGARSVQTPPRQ